MKLVPIIKIALALQIIIISQQLRADDEDDRLDRQRADEKIYQNKLEYQRLDRQRADEKVYQNKLDDQRFDRKRDDERWDRAHGRHF